MVRIQSASEKLLNDVLAQSVVPALKSAKFRKTGSHYHRRYGDTVHVINVQISLGANSAEKEFYVNVGIAFDAICKLAECPAKECPREYECDERGTRDRIRSFVSNAPDSWIVRDGGEIADTAKSLRDCIDRLLLELNRIDSIAAYRGHFWFDRFRPKRENAQILYLLGDLKGAQHEVNHLAILFSDRENANTSEWWVKRLHLAKLNTQHMK